MSRSLLILTEGDRRRGLGHVTRCSAYAEGWISRGGVVRWSLDGDDAARSVAETAGDVVIEPWLDRPGDFASADLVIVDTYRLTVSLAQAIAGGSRTAVFLDDLQALAYPASIVVHPALDPAPLRPDAAEWLAGPLWQPLRSAFWTLPPRAGAQDAIERILVTLGGGDTAVLGRKVALWLKQILPGTRIDLVAGHAEVEAEPGLVVHRGLSADAMAELMLRADLAVSAGGTTTFELARCGTPSLLIGMADNQDANLRCWPEACGFVNLGRADADLAARLSVEVSALHSPQVRSAISTRAMARVDGCGVTRLFDHLNERELRS